MRLLFYFLAWWVVSLAPSPAQTVTPAVPVDPTQARPAQPVLPESVTPPPPSVPAATSASVPAPTSAALSIIADSSLKQVLQELAQTWADSQESSPQVPLTLTNAGTLLGKMQNGGTWDVIIAADVADLKTMTDAGVLVADGQRSLARNTLVVYGRKPLVKDEDLDWFDLVGTEWKKVALGNPDLVASGRVAHHALQKHDLINDDNKDVFTYVAAEVLALGLAQGEQADAVFIYHTDLGKVNLPGFTVFPVATVDAPPVFYVAAVGAKSANPAQAQAFIDYCVTPAAKIIWTKHGFETD